MWHLHVLDTKSYLNDMNILFNQQKNKFIHHDIDGGLNTDERNKRYTQTIQQYKILFAQNPNQKYWGNVNVDSRSTE
eukprot:UN09132